MAQQLARQSRRVRRGANRNTSQEVLQVVKSLIGRNIEHKRATLNLNGVATTSGTVLSLTQFITEGDNINQRTGRLIRMTRMVLRYRRTVNSVTNSTAALRTIVFLDTQNQGAYPAVSDVLSSLVPHAGFEVVNAQQHRFRILLDRYESLCVASTTHTRADTYTFPLKYDVHYGGATDTPASNRKNTVFFLVIADNALAGPDWFLGISNEYTDA